MQLAFRVCFHCTDMELSHGVFELLYKSHNPKTFESQRRCIRKMNRQVSKTALQSGKAFLYNAGRLHSTRLSLWKNAYGDSRGFCNRITECWASWAQHSVMRNYCPALGKNKGQERIDTSAVFSRYFSSAGVLQLKKPSTANVVKKFVQHISRYEKKKRKQH